MPFPLVYANFAQINLALRPYLCNIIEHTKYYGCVEALTKVGKAQGYAADGCLRDVFWTMLMEGSGGLTQLLGGEDHDHHLVFPGNNLWKKDVAELETASIKVQLIYDKVLFMLHNHLPDSLWDAWIGVPYEIISSLYKGDNDSGSVFQKWIQGPSGWKCIGCERHCLEPVTAKGGVAQMLSAVLLFIMELARAWYFKL